MCVFLLFTVFESHLEKSHITNEASFCAKFFFMKRVRVEERAHKKRARNKLARKKACA